MNLKNIFLLAFCILLISINIMYGNAISSMLTVAIVASCIYYLLQVFTENLVQQKIKTIDTDNKDEVLHIANFAKQRTNLYSIGLMIAVFIFSIIAIKKIVNPTTNTAWFLNNDHHAISNTAIGFEDRLHFGFAESDSNANHGSIDFFKNGDDILLKTNNVCKPIFAQAYNNAKQCKVLNPIFTTQFIDKFCLQNATNRLDVKIQYASLGFIDQLKGIKKREVIYTINLQCTDADLLASMQLPNPYVDVITLRDDEIMHGKTLYNLWINNETWQSQKLETQQLFEKIIAEIDETYLLASYENENEKKYIIFPDEACLQNNYNMYVQNIMQPNNIATTTQLVKSQNFFIGFNNANEKMRVENFDGHTALVFDFPPKYLLNSAGLQHVGDKHIRFITTQFDNVITHPLKEGFYFAHHYLKNNYTVNAQLDYTADASKHKLAGSYTDIVSGKTIKDCTKQAWLHTQDAGVKFAVAITDLSDNEFSYNKLLGYATYLFLLFCIVLLLARSQKLNRIEPIIYASIYALLIVRFILYWRIATFPPLDNISKFEFQNTLLGFDFNLFGIHFPFPITLLFVTIIMGLVVLYRLVMQYKPIILSISFIKNANWKLDNAKNINVFYVFGMLLLLLFHFVIHVEILRRIIDVILPLLAYHYCSALANKFFAETTPTINRAQNKYLQFARILLYYFVNNPTFIITTTTICFFAIADRGFCVLFILFVLLKNVLLNFFKKSFDGSKQSVLQMFVKPWNYWLYGAIALLIYLVILGFKSLFYYLLLYKLWMVLLLLCIITIGIYLLHQTSKAFYSALVVTSIFTVLLLIPYTRKMADDKITNAIKHVQFRASIIHQPISSLLVNNAYHSFNTKKIIETAENQWFINTYISKPYDNSKQINLRAFSKVGVNYNTQTRDVVLARFVISEMGNMTMVLLLMIIALPMFIYLLSYKIRKDSEDEQTTSFDIDSYAGLMPLLLLFTIALFVWLTATNRFVFFGQDFPFLSITSRVSVLVPMLLYMLTLLQAPKAYNVNNLNLKLGVSRYIALLAIIVIVAITTFKTNELSNDNFNIEVAQTKQNIEGPLNQILQSVQDSVLRKNKTIGYERLIRATIATPQYQNFKNEKVVDAYSKSILEALEKNPSTALRANSPLYIVYDQGRYEALYNKNLYLELPATENKKVWNGNIAEANTAIKNQVFLHYGNNFNNNVALPYFKNDNVNAIQIAVMPKEWFVNATEHLGIINVQNKNGQPVKISICKNSSKNIEQKANQFVHTIATDDLVMVDANANHYQVSISNHQQVFATNKWLNGKYKTVYPQKENNFWMYHFANAVKNVYTTDANLTKNIGITLDYNWGLATEKLCKQTLAIKTNRDVKFTVIAADGDGNIRLMNDYVKNRKVLDPNDDYEIYKLQQKHFFFSNTGNERNQWANANLIYLHLGPGSSIKPLTAATMASQINAGWEKIQLHYTNVGEQKNYAGLPLAQPWEADPDSYNGQGMSDYIRKSSNYYQSILLFLGSYTKADFIDNSKQASIKNVVTLNGGKQNVFPKMTIDGVQYSLPNYDKGKGNWPVSDKSKSSKSFFANENSVLVNGLEINAGLACKDKDKGDMNILSSSRTNFTDSTMYAVLLKNKSSSFIWGFPEESAFPQINRHYISSKQKNEINENFNLGLKTTTLGGYPYQLTPYKMLEMYNALFTQNKNYEMHILPKKNKYVPWQIDSTWSREQFQLFLANNIYKGMADVITSGTATALASLQSVHKGYYFYAKTGTINEGGSNASNSRRLIVSITNKDLTKPENIGANTKVFSYYFATDNTGDFNWDMLRIIINQGFLQSSFITYFNQP